MHIRILFVLGLFLFSALTGCQSDTKNKVEEKEIAIKVPRFERDSSFKFVSQQIAFGPRIPNSEAHLSCQNYLASSLKKFGAEVIEQKFIAKSFDGKSLNGNNIIGRFNPSAQRRILLSAHWDSRPFTDSPITVGDKKQPVLGADDGASGVGVLLEIARQLQLNPVDFGVDIVFFDLEDYGDSNGGASETWCLGSQYFSKNLIYQSNNKPEYGILLDMVGASGARFAKEEISVQYAGNIVDKVWNLAQAMGYGNYFVNDRVGAITDDHYFVNSIAQIPMIDIINRPNDTQTGFVEHWHTPDDTLDKIDRNTLRAVGQLLLAVIYREHAGTL
jgi:Zn-dependent M28 family amino/carboxypeptidase